jgi:hypothetical protein
MKDLEAEQQRQESVCEREREQEHGRPRPTSRAAEEDAGRPEGHRGASLSLKILISCFSLFPIRRFGLFSLSIQ